jgi:tripartite-type tricarboxylate transporter receptor subunit TctC
MKLSTRRDALGLLMSLAAARPALAQADYPSKTVTVVVPTSPGGLLSLLGRLIANKLEQHFGKTVVVEYRAGAGTVVGANAVAHAAPDGYTMLIGATSTLATNLTLHKSLPYNPTTDFAPVILIARVAEALVIAPDLPVKSIADLVTLAKSKPGELTFGSAGPGTAQHLEGEQLKAALGIEMTHVPYKGIAPALNDVAGGHIAMMFAPVPIALPLIEGGKVRVLGVTSQERVAALPDARPLTEIGVRDFNAATWFMLVAPAGTPKAVVDKLHAALFEIMGTPQMHKELIAQGLVPVTSDPPDKLKTFIAAEVARYGAMVVQAGLKGSQ